MEQYVFKTVTDYRWIALSTAKRLKQ